MIFEQPLMLFDFTAGVTSICHQLTVWFYRQQQKEAKIGIHAILIERPTHLAAILTNGGQFGINTSSTLSLYSAWVDQYFPSVN